MTKRVPRPRTWLLSVATAASMIPACTQEHEAEGEFEPGDAREPADEGLRDAGRLPPPRADAGYFQGVMLTDGGFVGTIVHPDAGFVGSMVTPVDGSLPEEAGSPDAAPADAGCPDASPLLNGIIFQYDDAGCRDLIPGIVLRRIGDDE